jgi:4-amino-4-deoxy-L-arabinose transferase-like glycosyltransferase
MDVRPDNNDLFLGIAYLLLFAGLGCFLLALTRKHIQTRREQITLFLCALCVRFAASIVVYELDLVKVLGDEDSSGWGVGLALSNGWEKQQLGLLSLPEIWAEAYEKHHMGFQYLAGLFFFVTGASARMPLAAMNCFFGALTVVLVYRTAISLFSRWTAVRAGWVACFFPSLIIWSAQTLKEPVIIFLEALALYACVNLKLSGFSVKYGLLCAAAIILLPPFRFYAAYLASAVAIMALVIPRIGAQINARIGKRESSFKATLAALVVAALVAPLVLSSGYLARDEAYLERFTQLKEIERFRTNVAIGYGSGVESGYDLGSPTGLGMAIMVGGAHLLLAPFPWQLGGGSLRMLLTAPELAIWWWLVFAGLIPGLWHVCRRRLADVQPMLFFILGLGLLYSMMFGNVGLIFRQRAQLLPFLLIIAIVGLEQRALKKLLNRWVRPAAPVSIGEAGAAPSSPYSEVSAAVIK